MRRVYLENNILFLGEDNACLSLMAEAMAKHISPPKARVFSAGIKSGRIPPEVRRVLEEIGVNLTNISPKRVNEVPLNEIDLVVSFGDAHAKCDSLPRKAKIENGRSLIQPVPPAGLPLSFRSIAKEETRLINVWLPCFLTTG